jgi:hypothetical protein
MLPEPTDDAALGDQGGVEVEEVVAHGVGRVWGFNLGKVGNVGNGLRVDIYRPAR